MREINFPVGFLQAVAEGAGLTILPELYVELKLTGSGLWIIDLYDPVPRYSVRWSYRVIDTNILPRGSSAPSLERPCPASSPAQSTVTAAL